MMKVYVVEDSPVVQERLVAMLCEIPRVEVVGVSDTPSDALATILRLRPDVAVLDIRLRDGNGIDVLKGIRREAPGTTTIMLTNYASRTIRERCLKAGANHFFDKSTEFDRIRDVLANNEAPEACPSGVRDDDKEEEAMCGASCPLVEEAIAGDSNLARAATALGNTARGRTPRCPALHGIAVVDTDGIVRFCSDAAAGAFGAAPEALTGTPVAALIPELKLRAGTPGYNIAYALFWFPRQQWRQVEGVGRNGEPVQLELSISATRIGGRHQLLVAVRGTQPGRPLGLAHARQDGDGAVVQRRAAYRDCPADASTLAARASRRPELGSPPCR